MAPPPSVLTFKDKKLSFGDMSNVIRAAALRGYDKVMTDLGFEATTLLVQSGLGADALVDEDALLPIIAVCRLLEMSSDIAGCPDLGLRIARHQDFGVLGVLGLALQNASTPKQASSIVARFMFIQGSALRFRVETPSPIDPEAIAIVLDLDVPVGVPHRQATELLLGMGFQLGRLRSAHRTHIKSVSLPHAVGPNLAKHRRFFGVPVHENQPMAAMHIWASDWNRPVPDGNPRLHRLVEDYLTKTFPTPTTNLTEKVEMVLRPLIGTPQANREDVARMLVLHPRTLHRRLRQENTSFQQIKDDIRRDMAARYLTNTDVTLDQLTTLLGFPEQSALSRACRKWFSMPPGAVRRNRSPAAGNTIS